MSAVCAMLGCALCFAGCMAVHPDIDVSEVEEVDALTTLKASRVPIRAIETPAGASDAPPQIKRSQVFSKLQRGHRVQVQVYQEPELSGVFTIGESGTISVPLLGKVPIVGLSPSDAGRLLHRMLGDGYLADPLVSVNRVSDVSTGYHILGAVRDPGTYEMDDANTHMTLRDLLTAAGGPDDQAFLAGVMLVRQELTGPVAYPVHPSVLDPQRPTQSIIELQPGDIITVPWRFDERGGAK